MRWGRLTAVVSAAASVSKDTGAAAADSSIRGAHFFPGRLLQTVRLTLGASLESITGFSVMLVWGGVTRCGEMTTETPRYKGCVLWVYREKFGCSQSTKEVSFSSVNGLSNHTGLFGARLKARYPPGPHQNIRYTVPHGVVCHP